MYIAELSLGTHHLLLQLQLLHLKSVLSFAQYELFIDDVLVLEATLGARCMSLLHQHWYRVDYLLTIRANLAITSY